MFTVTVDVYRETDSPPPAAAEYSLTTPVFNQVPMARASRLDYITASATLVESNNFQISCLMISFRTVPSVVTAKYVVDDGRWCVSAKLSW